MANWTTSVGLKGRWDEEGVIPSEAEGGVEESMGSLAGVRPDARRASVTQNQKLKTDLGAAGRNVLTFKRSTL